MFEMRPFCLVLVICSWVMPNVGDTIQGNVDTQSIIHSLTLARHGLIPALFTMQYILLTSTPIVSESVNPL